MGKYDGMMKYLGKEDSFTPDQIKEGIESQEKMESLNDMSDISQQDIANVDKLINGTAASHSSPPSAPAGGDAHVDPEVLKEMEGLDAEPPNLEELQSRLQVTNYETPTEELMQEMTDQEESVGETPSGEEADSSILEPQFAKPDEKPEEEIPLPPMLDESAGETPVTFPETGGSDNVSDLLSQLKPTEQPEPVQPAGQDIQIPETPFEIPETAVPETATGGMETPSEPDLSSVFGPLEGSTAPDTQAEKLPEDFSFEMPKMDDKTGFETPFDTGEKPVKPEIPVESAGFDTSKLPRLDDEMPGLAAEQPRPDAGGRKKGNVHDEFMDIKDEFQEKKPRGEMPEILKPTAVKETKLTYGMEIDEDKAIKIRNRINKIVNPTLRKKVRYAFIEGKLPDNIMQQLIPMILLGEEEQDIAELIDSYVPESAIRGKEVTPEEKGAKPKRKVIHTEESLRAKDFQRDLQNITRYSFILFFVVILLGFLFWRGVYIPVRAGGYYNQGLTIIKSGDYRTAEGQRETVQSAEGKFEAGKSIGGPDTAWYNKFALAYEDKKLMAVAKRKYEDALKVKPTDKETLQNYSRYYMKLFPPQFEDAIRLYEILLKKYPNDFDYIDQTARIYTAWGDNTDDKTDLGKQDKEDRYQKADNLYTAYLQKSPKHIGSLFQRLDIALRGYNPQNIDALYDTIDSINKGAVNVPILTRLGEYYLDKRTENKHALDRARLVFEKLMNSSKVSDESFFQYARYLAINYDYVRAIDAVSNAIRKNPKMGKAYNLLGEIYYNNDTIPNNIILAAQNFETAIALSPSFYKPLANLGNVYFYNNLNLLDPEKALQNSFEYYKRAKVLYDVDLKKDGTNEILLYNLGWLYYYYGRIQKDPEFLTMAHDLFDVLYRVDPSNPVYSYVMGNTYYNLYKLNLGRKNSQLLNTARMEYTKAIEYYQAIADKISYVNPNVERHREVYGQLARCYNNRGVVNATFGKGDKVGESEDQALLDFYRSKDSANKINSVYTFAEYNIKYVLNPKIRSKKPAFDDELMKRTTLQKLTEELRQKMIKNL